MKKAYIASPFFNLAEERAVQQVEDILRERGIDFWSPRNNQFDDLKAGSHEWSMATYMNDIKAIDFCDFTIMIYFGNYSDSGTAFEAGYTIARGKPLIVVHVGGNSNLMVHTPAIANLTIEELKEYDFKSMRAVPYKGEMF